MRVRKKATMIGRTILTGLVGALAAVSQPTVASVSQIPLSTPPDNVLYRTLFDEIRIVHAFGRSRRMA